MSKDALTCAMLNFRIEQWYAWKETFAEMFASEIAASNSLKAIKEYLPESYEAFQEML